MGVGLAFFEFPVPVLLLWVTGGFRSGVGFRSGLCGFRVFFGFSWCGPQGFSGVRGRGLVFKGSNLPKTTSPVHPKPEI